MEVYKIWTRQSVWGWLWECKDTVYEVINNMKKYPYLEKVAKHAIDASWKDWAILITCIEWFQTDEEALNLRDFIHYASDIGVEVRFVPNN